MADGIFGISKLLSFFRNEEKIPNGFTKIFSSDDGEEFFVGNTTGNINFIDIFLSRENPSLIVKAKFKDTVDKSVLHGLDLFIKTSINSKDKGILV